MAGKRANGQGNVYLRADGRWTARLSYVDPITGKRRRSAVYGATQKATIAALDEMRNRLAQGVPAVDTKMTVAAWMATWRSTTLAIADLKPGTRAGYVRASELHIEPAPFGDHTLDRLRPVHIEQLIAGLRAKSLGSSAVRQVFQVLKSALDVAQRDGLIARNPVALVRRPALERTEARHLSTTETRKLLKAAEGSRYHPALVLIAQTGLRRGEACALRWSDVDMSARTLRVTGTVSRVGGELVRTEPKTATSRRVVPLSPSMVAILKKVRARQKRERMAAANVWGGRHDMVFTTEIGSLLDPRNLLRVVEAAAKAANLEDVGVHTLRHSAATAMLESGVHLKAVSTILGHASIAVTGDLYGHTSDDVARSAIEGLSSQLGQ